MPRTKPAPVTEPMVPYLPPQTHDAHDLLWVDSRWRAVCACHWWNVVDPHMGAVAR
jgi:hypothetical protein